MGLFSKEENKSSTPCVLVVHMVSGKSFKSNPKDPHQREFECVDRAEKYSREGFWSHPKDGSSVFYPPYQIQRIELISRP